MCGIAGIHRPDSLRDGDEARVRAMGQAIAHRGPFDRGSCAAGRFAAVHCRLPVIDPDCGAQPIRSPDGRLHLLMDGEVHNYVELRDRLAARGCAFRGKSDTEVVLALYRQVGEAFVNALDGMFAIAIYDEREGTLLLARDRLGIKPLYVARAGGGGRCFSPARSRRSSPAGWSSARSIPRRLPTTWSFSP